MQSPSDTGTTKWRDKAHNKEAVCFLKTSLYLNYSHEISSFIFLGYNLIHFDIAKTNMKGHYLWKELPDVIIIKCRLSYFFSSWGFVRHQADFSHFVYVAQALFIILPPQECVL